MNIAFLEEHWENMADLLAIAPRGNVTDYDRRHLALYAALLDADGAGAAWEDVATNLMGIDPLQVGSKACWRSHLERARWIVGEGLATALVAFNRRVTL